MLANDDYLNEKVDSNTIKLKSCGGVPNERTHFIKASNQFISHFCPKNLVSIKDQVPKYIFKDYFSNIFKNKFKAFLQTIIINYFKY